MNTRSHYSVAGALLLALASCSDSSRPAPDSAAPRSELPARYWAAEEPAGALAVSAVHASAKSGERVVLVGNVGGAERVFVDGAAVFTIVDLALASCVGDGMGCKTPWDYCCVDPRALQQGTALIEFRAEGRPLDASPRGFHGLDHLSTVVVTGTVERDEHQNLVVVADSIHVRS